MSEVIMVPDCNQRNGSNFDPNLLLATMMNGGNGFGGNGNWMWVIFLFFLFPLMRNGGLFGNGLFGNGDGRYMARGREYDDYDDDDRDMARGRARGGRGRGRY